MTNSSRIRVGAVNYLNTKPLIYGLAESAPNIDLVLDLPSRLADRLARGELDVALIPSVEFFQNPAYSIISDACIGCRGPVLSVKLFFRKPPAEVATLALDEGSRTSAALAKILLHERHGIRPQVEPLPIGSGVDATNADAVLLIGDRAMHSPTGKFVEVWDLGDEWCRWAELPFVFAMWVARPGVELGDVETQLSRARDVGLAHLDEIATREAPLLGLTKPECLSYLRDNLYFYLGPRELRGLEMYYRLAHKLELAPPGVEIGFSDCQSAG
jgi:chorismate dehydratase